MEITEPVFAICFVCIIPVAWAIAFGGVDIGRVIPSEAAKVTARMSATYPPMPASVVVPSSVPSIAMSGRIRLAVAVFDMNVAISIVTSAATKIIAYGDISANGIALITLLSRPVDFIARPSAKPPAISQSTSQLRFLRSKGVMIPVAQKTATGSIATTYDFRPKYEPKSQRSMVEVNMM